MKRVGAKSYRAQPVASALQSDRSILDCSVLYMGDDDAIPQFLIERYFARIARS